MIYLSQGKGRLRFHPRPEDRGLPAPPPLPPQVKRRSTCVACGESNPTCIEFHHKNGEDKDFAIGEAIANGYSKDQILREISKCIPLCVNCHRKLHYDKEVE